VSGKLSEVEGRIHTVHQLESVITAMRGSAAARSHEAKSRLAAIQAYAAAVGGAIGEALALAPQSDPPAHAHEDAGGHAIIALCAEQGFAGTFSERVLETAGKHLTEEGAELLVVGNRGTMVAAEHGLTVTWFAPMIAHADDVPRLADQISDAIYSRLEKNRMRRATVIHAVPAQSASIVIVERTLLPFDYARFKANPLAMPPLITLPAEQLLGELAEEYVYAELCEDVMLAFAAENEARMRAMIAARSNVVRKLDELVGNFRRLRQDEITDEIIELSAGSIAASSSASRKHG